MLLASLSQNVLTPQVFLGDYFITQVMHIDTLQYIELKL